MIENRLPTALRDLADDIEPAPDAFDRALAAGARLRRRRRATMAAGVTALAAVVATVVGVGHDKKLGVRTIDPARPTVTAPTPITPALGAPPVVAMTKTGDVVVLNPATGVQLRVLAHANPAAGRPSNRVAISPDGTTVYYSEPTNCSGTIWSVPVAGGTPARFAAGFAPAVTPDGTAVAYFDGRDGTPTTAEPCSYRFVERHLASRAETSRPFGPQSGGALSDPPVSISFSPGGNQFAVSVDAVQDNEGQATYLESEVGLGASNGGLSLAVPVKVPGTPADSKMYWQYGTFVDAHSLFIAETCCQGIDPGAKPSSRLLVVDAEPGNNVVRKVVATGFPDRSHTSLAVDHTGHWLLYLSGTDLYVSDDGARPVVAAHDLIGATW